MESPGVDWSAGDDEVPGIQLEACDVSELRKEYLESVLRKRG
jgi:hypothetical protein